MRQFYETYRNDQIVAPLVRQISWSHYLQILGQCKLLEEREFYLRMAVQEGWSKRQLERQIRAALFERVVLSPPKVAPVVLFEAGFRDVSFGVRILLSGYWDVRLKSRASPK